MDTMGEFSLFGLASMSILSTEIRELLLQNKSSIWCFSIVSYRVQLVEPNPSIRRNQVARMLDPEMTSLFSEPTF